MEAAGEFVSHNHWILLLPIVTFCLSFGFFIFWVYTATYIYSIGTPMYNPNSYFATIIWDRGTEAMMWFISVSLFWVISFIIHSQQFTVGAVACMWYFSPERDTSDDLHDVSINSALSWAIFTHGGSVALGSFILPVFSVFRAILQYMI